MKTILIAILLSIPIIASVALLVALQKNLQPVQNIAPTTKLEVATDPNFQEVKGQLIPGFPQFPVYPGAVVKKSLKAKQVQDPAKGYRAEWEIPQKKSVPEVMQWYLAELKNQGWVINEPPVDLQTYGEQVSKISKGDLMAYLNVEIGDDNNSTEIMVDIPEDK